MQSTLFSAHIRTRVFCFYLPTATLTNLRGELPMSLNPEHSDTFQFAIRRLPRDDTMIFSTTVLVSAAEKLPSNPRVTALNPRSEPLHLPLSNTAPVTPGTTTLHTHSLPDPYLEVIRPFNLQEFCNAKVWVEQRRSGIGSLVGPIFQTKAEALAQLAPQPESNLEYRALRAIENAMTCWMDTYQLRTDCFVEGTSFASAPAKKDPSLRDSVSPKRTWLDHWTYMDGLIYEASPGLGSKWVRCQDGVGYPDWVLQITERIRHRHEWLNPEPFFV